MTRGSYRIEGANNEVRDVVVEVGRPEGDLVVEQGLLKAEIETSTRLGSKIGIGDRVERREVHIQFGQGRCLEPCTVGGLQLGLGPGNDVCRGDTPRGVRPEALVIVIADVRDDKEQEAAGLRSTLGVTKRTNADCGVTSRAAAPQPCRILKTADLSVLLSARVPFARDRYP
jgi:hypothetical protein